MAQRVAAPLTMTSATGVVLPFLDLAPMFALTFHPARWMVLAGKLVPSLQKVPLLPGINRVEETRDREGRARFDLSTLRAKLEREGRILIPWEWGPDGSYVRVMETQPDGGATVRETHVSAWEDAEPGARETATDLEGYVEWLEELIATGRLPKCSYAIALGLLERAINRHATASASAAKNHHQGQAQLRAEALSQEVAVLRAYVEAHKPQGKGARKVAVPETAEGGKPQGKRPAKGE